MTIGLQRTLPIQYDEHGYGHFRVDPVTRTASRVALEAVIDFKNRRVIEARVERRVDWRPEQIAIGRAPTDSTWLLGRFRGGASVAHTITAAMALEMAYQTPPPALAVTTRSLGAAAEMVAAHTRQLFQLSGPDYSESAISRTNIGLWRSAQNSRAAGQVFHGHRTIADIMRAMNPIFGHLYRESLHLTRVACEIATLLFGKYPHPSALFPAGIGIVPDPDVYQQVLGRFNRLLDYSKKVTAVWDDLAAFFQQSAEPLDPAVESAQSLVSFGLWEDPESGDDRLDRRASRRYSTPGLMVDGLVVADDLSTIRRRLEDDKHAGFESGPVARLQITTAAGRLRNEFIESQRRDGRPGLMFDLPAFQMPATFLAWELPGRINALERNRARAYEIAYASLIALTCLLRSFEALGKGHKAMSNYYRVPDEAIGIGFWEEPAGAILHRVTIAGRRTTDYRVSSSDSWLQSASDQPRRLGVIEQALVHTPLVEEFSRPETFTGIDLLRVVRSFDC